MLKGIAAGLILGVAALVNLMYGGLIGAIFFALGLVTICVLELNLFTGKMGVVLNKQISIPKLILILVSNLIGIFIAMLLGMTLKSYDTMANTAFSIIDGRLEVSWYFIIARGMLCGICVEAAVEGYKKLNNPLVVLLPTTAFVLLGAHHCIADFGYWIYSDRSVIELLQIFEVFCGNIIGGLLFAIAS